MTGSSVARAFVERINAHAVDEVVSLMTRDHVFIDSLGTRFTRPQIESGWQEYFKMVPDYQIKIDSEVANGDLTVLFGTAEGTYVSGDGVIKPGNRWTTPAAWRVVTRGGKVSEWRIYSDNEPIRSVMRADR